MLYELAVGLHNFASAKSTDTNVKFCSGVDNSKTTAATIVGTSGTNTTLTINGQCTMELIYQSQTFKK